MRTHRGGKRHTYSIGLKSRIFKSRKFDWNFLMWKWPRNVAHRLSH
jgi:hypothetical protein